MTDWGKNICLFKTNIVSLNKYPDIYLSLKSISVAQFYIFCDSCLCYKLTLSLCGYQHNRLTNPTTFFQILTISPLLRCMFSHVFWLEQRVVFVSHSKFLILNLALPHLGSSLFIFRGIWNFTLNRQATVTRKLF